ncbi:MAG TPA: N-acetylmuramoyl-L-alanine amidase [Thermodesulfobacteriota bacterium]|nr:N-acetylmuramoyl-L-alanine amidase [Thermodesulfobacteriota bacterium]
MADPQKVNNEEIWKTIAQLFYTIYIEYPESPKASDSLFLSGKMYEEMGTRFNSKDYFKVSIDHSTEFIKSFPNSDLADDAGIRIARIVENWDKSRAYLEYEKVLISYSEGDMAYIAKNKVQDLALYKPTEEDINKGTPEIETNGKLDSLAYVNQIRHWSTDNYTRVVIDLNKEVPFDSHFLKSDSAQGIPTRLFVDIKDATIDRNLAVDPIKNGLLNNIKFGRNTSDTARVVLYMDNFKTYRVFSLYEPFRIVMDVYGDETPVAEQKESDNREEIITGLQKFDGKSISHLRGALGLKVRTIVIDAGHGGHDPGAIGPTRLKEKDVNLAIAKALKRKFELAGRSFGVSRVILTRDDDRFIPLEERPAIAKKEKADLFISVHCNAARNGSARGTETYILSFTGDPEALAVAARENVSTTKSLSDLEDIVKNYLLSSKIDESKRLASYVQNSLVEHISDRYEPVKNKGVKKAPFIVLIGADVPSILVETSFITNPLDEKMLRSPGYINGVADGIFAGVKAYSTEVETAFLGQ